MRCARLPMPATPALQTKFGTANTQRYSPKGWLVRRITYTMRATYQLSLVIGGGQVTYHGPGQLIAYPLIDLKRAGYFVKEYVYKLEEAVIRTLATLNVVGHRVRSAPGIYVRLDNPFDHAKLGTAEPGEDPFRGLGKISALGIKVSRHCTYHGLALNVQMDLQPFDRINPCGYAGLRTVDLHTIGVSVPVAEIQTTLDRYLRQFLVTP